MRLGASARYRDGYAGRRHESDSRGAAGAAAGEVAIAWRGSALASVYLTFEGGLELQ
jgi:hypothetical protein